MVRQDPTRDHLVTDIIRFQPWTELEPAVRAVPLLKLDRTQQLIHPYRDARIHLREVHPDELSPTSFYVIQRNLDFQKRLHAELLTKGHDTLHLEGLLEIRNDQGEIWGLMPPVVEVMHEHITHLNAHGDIDYQHKPTTVAVHIINDGLHRVLLARELNRTITVIHVTGAKPPFYALPNGWDQVQTFTDTPHSKEEKKFYRRNDCYALSRDFGVLGCGKPRNTGSGKPV